MKKNVKNKEEYVLGGKETSIILNAGHFDKDSGAVNGKFLENQMTVVLRNIVAENLSQQGYKVYSVPDNLNLKQSIEWANKRANESSIMLDLHFDAVSDPQVGGTTAYFYRNEILAATFSRCVAQAIGINNNGARMDNRSQYERLAWCRDTIGRAIVLENCYFSSPENMEKYSYEKNAQGIVNAINEIDSPKVIVVDAPKKIRVLTIEEKEKISILQTWLELLKTKLSFIKLRSNKLGAIEAPAGERSLTQKANIITIVISILALFGIYITEADLNGFLIIVGALGTLVSSLISYYARWRIGDLTFSGLRKK